MLICGWECVVLEERQSVKAPDFDKGADQEWCCLGERELAP
jgi:hypothetical protein